MIFLETNRREVGYRRIDSDKICTPSQRTAKYSCQRRTARIGTLSLDAGKNGCKIAYSSYHDTQTCPLLHPSGAPLRLSNPEERQSEELITSQKLAFG